jgi:hypothetical protein
MKPGEDAILQRLRVAAEHRADTAETADGAYRELCHAIACARAAGVSLGRCAAVTGLSKRGVVLAAAKGAETVEVRR